jgi:hypothetical protein
VLGFGDDTASGFSWSPHIAFHNPIDDKTYAVIRTISDVEASVYSPGDDIITTDLVAISDPTYSGDIGVRLTVAGDYGAAPLASVGVYSRYGGFDNEVVITGDYTRINSELHVRQDAEMRAGFAWTGPVDDNRDPFFFVLRNLPTTDLNLPSGALWNDAGTLKIAD